MPKNKSYCIYPNCENKKKTDKFLFSSPENPRLRERWLKEMNCQRRYSPNTRFSVCEDHFDLPNDLQNYTRFLYGRNIYTQHKLKDDVVPSKFVMGEEISIPTYAEETIKREDVMFIDVGTPILENTENTTADKGSQCNIIPTTYNKVSQCYFAPVMPKKRSKSVQTSDNGPVRLKKRSKSVQTSEALFTEDTVLTRDVALSPIIFEDTPTL